MTRRILSLVAVTAMVVAVSFGGGKKAGVVEAVIMPETPVAIDVPIVPTPDTGPVTDSPVGTYTTLNGFYDYQVNGGAAQYIRVNPANGNIHVIFMNATDSLSVSASRGTAYAFSTNGGATWNNFSNLRVPTRRSGFPTLDLLKGANAGLPAVANHSTITNTESTSFVDSPEGAGAFAELAPPTSLSGTDQPIWPYVTGPSDGSIVMHSSRSGGGDNYLSRTTDFATWSAWLQHPLPNSAGGRYSTQSNGTGRVGTLLNGVSGGVSWLESTDNGATWPASSTNIFPAAPPGRIAGADTFQAWVGSDFTYDGNNALVAINELNIGANTPTSDEQILFWSAATGYKVAATRINTPGVVATLNRSQVNHFAIGYPAIGMSGSRIVIAYNGFMPETSASGWNYSDIFYVHSGDGGNTWSTPVNITNTPNLDERYPGMSKYNASGFANVVWQEDTQPGASAFNDLAPLSRSRQVFYRFTVVGVGEDEGLATSFKLSQNFPNPFNPATKISYTVPTGTEVKLSVHNILGQEVATLANGYRNAGSYEEIFSADHLPSGVYFYTLRAGKFAETKKMMLLK